MNVFWIMVSLLLLAILLRWLEVRHRQWKPRTPADRQRVLLEVLSQLETRYQLEQGMTVERYIQSQPTAAARKAAYSLLAGQMNDYLRYKNIRLFVTGSIVCWLLTERVSKRLEMQAEVTS